MFRIPETIKHLFLVSLVVLAIGFFLKIDLTNISALHFPTNENFGIWQYITHLFMHADFGHLFFNFIAIWFFGSPLAESWGTKKFLFFFFSAGVGAALIYTLVNYIQFNNVYNYMLSIGVTENQIYEFLEINAQSVKEFTRQANVILNNSTSLTEPVDLGEIIKINGISNTPAIGASGAVYAVMTAYAVNFPNSRIRLLFPPIALIAKYYIATLIAADLFLGILNRVEDNVARFAHVGGALVGFLIAYYWKKNQFNYRR